MTLKTKKISLGRMEILCGGMDGGIIKQIHLKKD